MACARIVAEVGGVEGEEKGRQPSPLGGARVADHHLRQTHSRTYSGLPVRVHSPGYQAWVHLRGCELLHQPQRLDGVEHQLEQFLQQNFDFSKFF